MNSNDFEFDESLLFSEEKKAEDKKEDKKEDKTEEKTIEAMISSAITSVKEKEKQLQDGVLFLFKCFICLEPKASRPELVFDEFSSDEDLPAVLSSTNTAI